MSDQAGETTARWACVEAADAVHVVPIDDVVEHDLHGDCACGPTQERVDHSGGGDAWLTVHHSLDGREATE